MAKVKWDARSDYEYINNYKILQRVFAKNKVEKVRVSPLWLVSCGFLPAARASPSIAPIGRRGGLLRDPT